MDQRSNQVLGIDGENCAGSNVKLQTKKTPESLDQKWKRVTMDDEKFFALSNLKSGLFLNNGQETTWPSEFSTIESM